MTNDKPENNENPIAEKQHKSFEVEKKASRKFIEGTAQTLIRWLPLGGN